MIESGYVLQSTFCYLFTNSYINKPEQAIVFPLKLKIIQVNSLYIKTIKRIISNNFGHRIELRKMSENG